MRGILFDWDGTLVDSEKGLVAAYRAATSTILGAAEPVTDADADELLEMGDHAALGILGDQATLREQLSERFRAAYREARDSMVSLYPGVPDVMRALRDRDWLIGVISNGDRLRVHEELQCFGLIEYVDVWITGQDTPAWVPHPAPVRLALDRMGLAPQDTVYVGDRPADIIAGRTAGSRTAAVLHGPAAELVRREAPDFSVSTINDIVAVVDLLDRERGLQR